MVTANTEFQYKNIYGKKTNTSSPILWIFTHVYHYKALILIILLTSVLSSIFFSLVPTLIGQVANLLSTKSTDIGLLVFFGFAILVAGVLNSLMELFFYFANEFLANRVDRDARDELYQSMLGKSMTFHDKQAIGDLMERSAQDVRQLYFMISPGFLLVFQSILMIITPIVFIYFINPQLVIIPILFVISYVLFLKRYNKNLENASWLQRVAASSISSRLNEVISGMYLVRGASQEEQERQIFSKNIREYKKHTIEIGDLQA